MEEAGELAATEMPNRPERMHCAHGEGSPRYAARARRGREGAGVATEPEQTDWRESESTPILLTPLCRHLTITVFGPVRLFELLLTEVSKRRECLNSTGGTLEY